jgi:plasmid replication initiation protein
LESKLVVKSNELIQATYSLSVIEQRLCLLAIIEARASGKGITADNHLTIHASKYAEQFNVSLDAAYKALKDGVINLFERQITVYDSYKGTNRKRVTRWVSEITYIESRGEIQLIFAPLIVPEIVRLEKKFTSYEIKQVSGLSSAYALRLFELLIQWKNSPKIPIFKIERLREQLGVEPQEYKLMSNFKKFVLDKAILEINSKTDLILKYEQIKNGKRITGFNFSIGIRKINKATKNDDLFKDKILKWGLAEENLFKTLLKKCPNLTKYYIEKMAIEQDLDINLVLSSLNVKYAKDTSFSMTHL